MVYISHHGIRGQRWGVSNGPPYPLSAGSHNAFERKAGWKKSLTGGSNVVTKKKSKKSEEETKEKKSSKSTNVSQNTSSQNDINTNAEGFHLTDKQKKMLKTGAIVLGVTVAAVGAYELAKYSGIKQRAGKAAAQKALKELGQASSQLTKDIYSNTKTTGEFKEKAFKSAMGQAERRIKEANRKEYQQLVKNAWKEELSGQVGRIKSGIGGDAYEKALKKAV